MLEPVTGGPTVTTPASMFPLSLTTWPAVSGTPELLMTGSTALLTCISMTTSSETRSSPTMTCPSSTMTTEPSPSLWPGASHGQCTSITTTRAEPCVSSHQTPASVHLVCTPPPPAWAHWQVMCPVPGEDVTPRRRSTLSTMDSSLLPDLLPDSSHLNK